MIRGMVGEREVERRKRGFPAIFAKGAMSAPVALALPGVWLLFLLLPVSARWSDRGEGEVQIGYAAIAAFAVLYLSAFEMLRRGRDRETAELSMRTGVFLICAMVVADVIIVSSLGQRATGTAIYLAVVAVVLLPVISAAVLIVSMATALLVASFVVDGWDPDWATPALVLCAGFLMWGIRRIVERNQALITQREQSTAKLLQQERSRFAQDLHDILGHSLTVIAVKSELAGKLIDIDLDRARTEVQDLERLARDALADVRRAVHGYKDLSLVTEIPKARQALESAGIEAQLPRFVAHVDPHLRDLFAWTMREGITNVIRHSSASICTVELYSDRIIIEDDGVGLPGGDTTRDPKQDESWERVGAGHGLSGLVERASAVGAEVRTRSLPTGGFILEVVGGPKP